jgi:hypothetical protein
MNDVAEVRQAIDRILGGDLRPMLDLLADDVQFCVAVGGDAPFCLEDLGKQSVLDYFTALGGLVTFWQMDYTVRGDQLIAWGRESFTIERCELQGGCEFALVLDVAHGQITRFLVVEDLPSFIREGRLEAAGPARTSTWRPGRTPPSHPVVFSTPARSEFPLVGSRRDFGRARSSHRFSPPRPTRSPAPYDSDRRH